VALQLDRNIGAEMRGSVITGTDNMPKVTDRVRLKIFVTGSFGRSMYAKFNGVDIPCKVVKVLRSIDVATGDERSSTKVKPLDAVEAEVRLSRRVPVENYDVTRELGRFVLYTGNAFAGIGTLNG
jgi:sulfate adenylyltransferase subunit 1 (EFTu-like GTPase family)